MKRAGRMCMILALAAAASPAAAQEATLTPTETTVSAAVTGGTLGIGPELGFRLSDHVAIRGNATFLGLHASPEPDDIEYDARLKLKSFGAMVDVYPFGGSFHLSAGARINRNRADLNANLSGGSTIDVGDETYTAAEVGVLSGRADVKRFAPALTLGWNGGNHRGFLFGFEAGALFQGAVRIREFRATGTLANDPDFRASLERERRDIQDDVNKYKVYPILMTSIGWRF